MNEKLNKINEIDILDIMEDIAFYLEGNDEEEGFETN